jgi:hypothetical protein
MKNPAQERLRRNMRQYHRHHQWRLRAGGVYIPHLYAAYRPLTWWDDVGFVLNNRRIMVWWIHPRMKYADAIENQAWAEAGDPPLHPGALSSLGKIWKKVGRSRKKVAAYHCSPAPAGQQAFHEKLSDIGQRLEEEGIDLLVRPSMTVKSFGWCTGIDLCIPIEVRNDADATALADLAKRLIKGETTLADEFPEYRYDRSAWLAEAFLREQGMELAVVA